MFKSRTQNEQSGAEPSSMDAAVEVDASIQAFRRGDVQKAIERAQKVCESYPKHVDGWMMLGIYLKEAHRWDEAEACLVQSMRLEPKNPSVHNNLGNLLKIVGRFEEAENRYRKACRLAPGELDYQLNLGRHLMFEGKEKEGMQVLQEASDQHQGCWECKQALGVAYLQLFALDQAEACFSEVIKLNRRYAEAYANLGSALVCQNRHAEAREALERAIELNPFLPQPYWNLSIIFLREENFNRGWSLHEWRRKLPGYEERVEAHKEWNGRELKDKTILLRAEQGLGDTLQFIRYAPLVKQSVGRVVLECQDELLNILKDYPGVDEVVGRSGEGVVYDEALPLLSVPWVLGLKRAYLEESVPYLGDYVRQIRGEKLRVGLTWSGSKQHPQDVLRSIKLEELHVLSRVPDIEWVCVQKEGVEDLRRVGWGMEIPGLESFTSTQTVLEGLDLIITVDTAIAHLAGAMGMPVWTFIQFSSDWRWGMEADNTLWYPSMRLFRQKSFRDWSHTIGEIEDALCKEVEGRSAS